MISVFRPFDIEEEKRRISGDSEDSGVNSSSGKCFIYFISKNFNLLNNDGFNYFK